MYRAEGPRAPHWAWGVGENLPIVIGILATATRLTGKDIRWAAITRAIRMQGTAMRRAASAWHSRSVSASMWRSWQSRRFRSEARRVGKECGSTCRSRWAADIAQNTRKQVGLQLTTG